MPAAFLLGEILYTGGLGSTSMMLLEVTDADGNQLYWSEDCMEAYKASSVEGVGVDAADAQSEYFNLKGVRIAEPEPGLYIRRHGDTTTKVIVK